MDKKNAQVAWITAAVLAVLLLITLVFWWNAKQEVTALKNGSGNITLQKDKIRADCSATDAASKLQCGQDLQDLADTIREFSKTAPATQGTGAFKVSQ